MRRLQNREDLAGGHEATVSIPSSQGVAELTLASPFTYLPLDQRPAINTFRVIRILDVRFSLTRLLGTQKAFTGQNECRVWRGHGLG